MRKQTKLVAVASAAALLAIGASMTSFAATGWVEEGGEWFYYEKDGSKAEDTWKKSGDKWFWLDSEESGAMAIDKLVVDDENTYYVDSTGAMVSNTWVKVVNEEQDDEEDPAEYNYYYMQSNGKAYKSGDTSTTKFKTIDGKRYAFDSDGKMLYGWVNSNSERLTEDTGWSEVTGEDGVYYLGNWDDGAMKTGWQRIYVYDDEEDEDMDHWFYFNSNGKRFQQTGDTYRTKKVNGKRYGFDERGVMIYEWVIASGDEVTSPTNWSYFNSPEDGARVTKGWFKVIPPSEDNTFEAGYTNANSFDAGGADAEDEYWYYADDKGKLYAGEIKRIKGKYYAFAPDGTDYEHPGRMLNGLVLMLVEGSTIRDVADDGVDTDELSDLIDCEPDDKYGELLDAGYSLYYFGNDADTDGSMKTGNSTINLDGDSYTFMFDKTGANRGKGITGMDDNKYIYKAGCRIKADSDDKYQVVELDGEDGNVDYKTGGVTVSKISSSEFFADGSGVEKYYNNDGDPVRYNDLSAEAYYLVNTTGSVQKSKTAAKDGAEYYFYVNKQRKVQLVTDEKDLKNTGDKVADGEPTVNKWEDLVNEN